MIVATLGVAIGANVALFSVVRGVLLRPLPYPDADQLVRVWETNPQVDDELHGPSPLNFAAPNSPETRPSPYFTRGAAWVRERDVPALRGSDGTPGEAMGTALASGTRDVTRCRACSPGPRASASADAESGVRGEEAGRLRAL